MAEATEGMRHQVDHNSKTLFYEPVSVSPGDLWDLGKHRLLCGDAGKLSDIQRLLQDECPDAIITDPPYGQINAKWDTINLAFIPHLAHIIRDDTTIAMFCSLPFGFLLHAEMIKADYQWRWGIIWGKQNGGFQVSQKAPIPCHEHIFAYARSGVSPSCLIFNGWDAGEKMHVYRKVNNSGIGETAEVYSHKHIAIRAGHPEGNRWIRSILYGRKKSNMREVERYPHPTQKPLEVLSPLVLLLSHPDGLLFDPFLGSGTTLIAAEMEQRRCYGIEISPDYCSIIVNRWQHHTGRQAIKRKAGR